MEPRDIVTAVLAANMLLAGAIGTGAALLGVPLPRGWRQATLMMLAWPVLLPVEAYRELGRRARG